MDRDRHDPVIKSALIETTMQAEKKGGPRVLRDESTPEGREMWRTVDRVALGALHAITLGEPLCRCGTMLADNTCPVWKEQMRLLRPAQTIPMTADQKETMGTFGKSLLTTDKQERKNTPIARGVLDYFPLAIAAIARLSRAGSLQHHPEKHMHWDRTKSNDHADAIARHLIERGGRDDDGQRHSAKLAWRSLALLQLEEEEAAR